MTDETTTEQLVEIEGQAQSTPATEYTPPEGWQEVPLGEPLKGGDEYHAGLDRYIRRIKPQPQLQPQPQPPVPQDADQMIRLLSEANHSHVAMIGRLQARINDLETIRDTQAAAIEELRSEVSYVQRLLGESRQRVTQLEELVSSLRTINEAQEKAFEAAGKHNSDLQSRLNAVYSDWLQQTETIRRLQIELDAARQVPADSPELRQLRADLAEVTRERDQYLDSYQRIFGDLETIRETTKAAAVEAIVEWLVPIRTCGSQALATAVISNLPHIMRSLTGLEDEDIE